MKHTWSTQVTIPAGQNATSPIPCKGAQVYSITWPAAMTSTSAAIYGGNAATALAPLYQMNGTPLECVVQPGGITIGYWDVAMLPFVQIVTNQNEAAERTLTLTFCEDI